MVRTWAMWPRRSGVSSVMLRPAVRTVQPASLRHCKTVPTFSGWVSVSVTSPPQAAAAQR